MLTWTRSLLFERVSTRFLLKDGPTVFARVLFGFKYFSGGRLRHAAGVTVTNAGILGPPRAGRARSVAAIVTEIER